MITAWADETDCADCGKTDAEFKFTLPILADCPVCSKCAEAYDSADLVTSDQRIDCGIVTPTGVAHRQQADLRTNCGRPVPSGSTVYKRARDCVNHEDARPCRSCFPAWRGR